MRPDEVLRFSSAQAVTSTGDTDSTNTVDFGSAKNANRDLWLVVQPTETVTSSGAATVSVVIQTSEAPTSGFKKVWQSAPITKDDLVMGKFRLESELPRGLKRYMKITYNVGTAALTAGKFDAFLTDAVPGSAEVI